MKKPAKYLGIPCYYDDETHEISGRNKLSAFVMYFAIIIDNKLSWVYWKITGKERSGAVQIFYRSDAAWYSFPWTPVLFWTIFMDLYLLCGGKVFLILFFISFLFCIVKIVLYLMETWK